MSINDTIKNLRAAAVIDKDGIDFVADQLEQLQADNERLKAEKPVMCGECKYYEHSELEGVNSHCGRMEGGICGRDLKPWEFCSYGERRDAE